jgi:transcriptional regulator with XRE-family HTH domain
MDIKILDFKIYALIKKLRLEKSLSQEGLAHLAEKDRTYISSIERGERNISLKTLIDILSALEIDMETFLQELQSDEL